MVPFFPIAAAASRTFAGVIFGLRPPVLPNVAPSWTVMLLILQFFGKEGGPIVRAI